VGPTSQDVASSRGNGSITPDALRQEYTIETPENVSFRYDVAGIGSRFIGALVDTLLVGLLLALLNVVIFFLLGVFGNEELFLFGLEGDIGWVAGLLLAIYALLNFALFWGYYMLFELLLNGQTPGKRVARTRVVRLDGEPAGMTEVAIRNLVRIVDFLPTLYAVGLVTMFLNDQARRLGDFAAGTLVVRDDASIRLASLGAPARPAGERPPARIEPLGGAAPAALAPLHLRRLTHDDYMLIRDALARDLEGALPFATLRRLAELIALKVEAPAPDPSRVETRRFLVEVADAYEGRPSAPPSEAP
jgi:uncharacterized RDD family membrane protein YckC